MLLRTVPCGERLVGRAAGCDMQSRMVTDMRPTHMERLERGLSGG